MSTEMIFALILVAGVIMIGLVGGGVARPLLTRSAASASNG